MPFKIAEARKNLQSFDLKKLFIEEMGWDNPGSDLVIRFNGQNIKLKAIAQKRGFGVFVHVMEGHFANQEQVPAFFGRQG